MIKVEKSKVLWDKFIDILFFAIAVIFSLYEKESATVFISSVCLTNHIIDFFIILSMKEEVE